MVERLGVTATAVRQRISRLLASELINRVEKSVGRGRPSHHYQLTEKGKQTAGNNLSDLALVLWEEILKIEDPATKQKLIAGVITRLKSKYEKSVEGESVKDRFASMAELLGERKIPLSVDQSGDLPVLKMHSCPYPELVDDNREICKVEQQLFSTLLQSELTVERDDSDGTNHCCTFQPKQESTN